MSTLTLAILILWQSPLQAKDSVEELQISIVVNNTPLKRVLQEIEIQTGLKFFYLSSQIDTERRVSIEAQQMPLRTVLDRLFTNTSISYSFTGKQIVLKFLEEEVMNREVGEVPRPESLEVQATESVLQVEPVYVYEVSGKVLNEDSQPLPGVSVIIKGTTSGTTTDMEGEFALEVPDNDAILVFSFIGYQTKEVPAGGRTVIDVTLVPDVKVLGEIVVVGFGTMRKRDLTGSVVRADIENFRDQPNVSIIESLQGTIPGLNVGQIDQAGAEPDISIRGRTSLSGESNPLIIVDNAIYRGNLIDLNPNDIASIDVLKDASAAAIYGSQASNGVILITTKRSGGAIDAKPLVSYNYSYAFQKPNKELRPDSPEGFMRKTEISDIYNSRTEASGYLERNPTWDPTSNFKGPDELNAYQQGRTTDWYSLLTNDNMNYQSHNISLSNATKYNNYFISLGYTAQNGYMLNEDYKRWNARININNNITDWLEIGAQTFMTLSDYSGLDVALNHRYIAPYQTAYNAAGEYNLQPGGNSINPLIQVDADNVDKRLHLYGNVYANISIPFVQGLSYRLNLANNLRTTHEYIFQPYAQNFLGQGSKMDGMGYDMNFDNIVSYKREFNSIHKIDVTLLYGIEKRNYNSTLARASVFNNLALGYNNLQSGSSELQQTVTSAWEEASLYNMARIFYSFRDTYMFTGTIRRDGFSGFGEANKFGLFPSLAAAWIVSNEDFFPRAVELFKIRASYGANGNRTIGRYETLAEVEGGFNYITADGTPVYTHGISSLASPNLKWETTTGVNVGIDFAFLSSRIQGSIDYYNNNTSNLLYQVDIPGISRFTKFPDNLGRIHNEGVEIAITSTNVQTGNMQWTSSFAFSRNRNQLKELLGFDLDNDGKEDDLISAGLFINEPLDAIYTYQVDGKWQTNEEVAPGYDLGANKVVDLTGDGSINASDRTIIGYSEPAYRFSVNNRLSYGNWTLNVFVNSVQGGSNYYMASDDMLDWKIFGDNSYNFNFPKGLDYWSPENPGGIYQRPNISRISEGIQGTRYIQRNFVRLQNVSLAYNFPTEKISRYKIQRLRLFLSGKNLGTWTKWPGWDPETGTAITPEGRPVMKSYSLGVEIEF